MQPVKTSGSLDVRALLADFAAVAPEKGFDVHEYGHVDGFPLLALTRRARGVHPRIYLSGGCHGDEPAGPLAILKLLKHGFFDGRAHWIICPALNPVGLQHQTRENAQGIDLNRDYKQPRSSEIYAHVRWLTQQPRFDVTLCLHEDWETSGFYVYELNPEGRPSIASEIVRAVSVVCPIELAELIDGREGKDGIIRPIHDPMLRDAWPEAIYLRAHHSNLCFTTETPSARRVEQRIAAQCISIETVVEASVNHRL